MSGKVDVVIAVVGGAQELFTAGNQVSLLSAAGQAIAGVVSFAAPIGGAIADIWSFHTNVCKRKGKRRMRSAHTAISVRSYVWIGNSNGS